MGKCWSLVFAVGVCILCWTMPAAATVGGAVTPHQVMPGDTVSVTGVVPVPGCPVNGTVIVQGIGLWADPSGFVAGSYDAAGHFSVHGRVSPTLTLGSHSFLIRCAGRNEPLGPAAGGEIGPGRDATFTVVGLPRTGGSIGPVSDTTAAIIASVFIALGLLVAFRAGTRRNAIDS